MPQRVLGIDVGTWSAKAVLVEAAFRGFKVVAAEEVRVDAGDPEEAPQRQTAALAALLEDPKLRADVVCTALPGDQATARWIRLPFTDARRVDQVIEGELADLIPFPIEDAVFDHALVRRDDGASTTIAAAAPRSAVARRLDMLAEAGTDPKFLPLDVCQLGALHHQVLSEDSTPVDAPEPTSDAPTAVQAVPDGPPAARLIVDVGHRRTLVCAVNDDGVHHVRVLRTGGASVTQAIAASLGIDVEEAEGLKHREGFVASSRLPAFDDDAQAMSEATARGLVDLVRDLRRTLQMIRKERRVHIERVDLMGGGSKLKNLASYLAEQLNLPTAAALVVDQTVEREVEPQRAAAFALAVSLALRANPKGSLPRLDFRQEEFAFAGTLQHFRRRVPFMAVTAAGLMVLLLLSVAARYRAVVEREAVIDRQFCRITKEVIGREICEPGLAISVMQSPESELGAFNLPQRSAYAYVAEISSRVPDGLDILITDIDVTPDRITIDGEADSFDAVDQLVGAYAESPCLDEIKKSNISKKAVGEGVDFTLNMRTRCTS
jgi:general secretion pathway protein L